MDPRRRNNHPPQGSNASQQYQQTGQNQYAGYANAPPNQSQVYPQQPLDPRFSSQQAARPPFPPNAGQMAPPSFPPQSSRPPQSYGPGAGTPPPNKARYPTPPIGYSNSGARVDGDVKQEVDAGVGSGDVDMANGSSSSHTRKRPLFCVVCASNNVSARQPGYLV